MGGFTILCEFRAWLSDGFQLAIVEISFGAGGGRRDEQVGGPRS
jgi:hypothetical protein